MTHSTIEAVHQIQEVAQIQPLEIEKIKIFVAKGCCDVCGIPIPETGLEAKFSLRFCAASVIAGLDTARLDTFSDENTKEPVLAGLLEKVEVTEKSSLDRMEAEVTVSTKAGIVHFKKYDAGIPAADLVLQWEKLVKKFNGCAEPIIGKDKSTKIVSTVHALQNLDDISDLVELLS